MLQNFQVNCKAAGCTVIEILSSLFKGDRLSEYTCYSNDSVGTLRTIEDFLTKWMQLYIKLFCFALLHTKKKEKRSTNKKRHIHKEDNLCVIRNQVSRVLIMPVPKPNLKSAGS